MKGPPALPRGRPAAGMEEVAADVVHVVGNRGSRVALVRVWRAGAPAPLLVRAQVTHTLCPADCAARTGAALAAVLAADSDSDEDEEWTSGHAAADTVRGAAAASRMWFRDLNGLQGRAAARRR